MWPEQSTQINQLLSVNCIHDFGNGATETNCFFFFSQKQCHSAQTFILGPRFCSELIVLELGEGYNNSFLLLITRQNGFWFSVFCILNGTSFFSYLVAVFRWEKSEPVQSKPHIVTRIQITWFWFFKKYSLFWNRKHIRAKHNWEFEMVFVQPRTFRLKSLRVALGSRVASYIPLHQKCFHDTFPGIALKKLNV